MDQEKFKSEKSITKKQTIITTSKEKTNKLSESFHIRIQNFNRNLPPELEQGKYKIVMKAGTIPLFNPNNHAFRNKSIQPNIYIRRLFLLRYAKQSEKQLKNCQDYKETHLESEKYFKLDQYWLRKLKSPIPSTEKR
jgi:hypothetical protein